MGKGAEILGKKIKILKNRDGEEYLIVGKFIRIEKYSNCPRGGQNCPRENF